MNEPSAAPSSPRAGGLPQLRRRGARPLLPGLRPGDCARAAAAGAFLREAAGRYVALDGRLARTLFHLLFRPGFLTREYLAGRRKRYIRPARLFLVLALALFAVLRVASEAQPGGAIVFDAAPRRPPPPRAPTRSRQSAAPSR